MKKEQSQLPQVAFSILLALSLRERHGYEIIKQVKEDTDGKITLGPGALYTSIKHLREKGLIVEVKHDEDTARRYYKLTDNGKQALVHELEYYQNIIGVARKRQLLTANFYA